MRNISSFFFCSLPSNSAANGLTIANITDHLQSAAFQIFLKESGVEGEGGNKNYRSTHRHTGGGDIKIK